MHLKKIRRKKNIGDSFRRNNVKTFYIRSEGIVWIEKISEQENNID